MTAPLLALLLASNGAGISYNPNTVVPSLTIAGVPNDMLDAPLNLFVSGANALFADGGHGNDAYLPCNNVAAPCATIQVALNQVPRCWNAPIHLGIDGGSYAGGFLERQPWCVGGSNVDGGTGYLDVQGQMVAATLGQGTATGTSSAGSCGAYPAYCTLADGTQNWAVNGLVGFRLNLGCAGCVYQVKSNTATVITATIGHADGLNGPFVEWDLSGFAASKAYTIEDWATKIATEVTPPAASFFPVPYTAGGISTSTPTGTAGLALSIPPGPFRENQVVVRDLSFTSTNRGARLTGGAYNFFGDKFSGQTAAGVVIPAPLQTLAWDRNWVDGSSYGVFATAGAPVGVVLHTGNETASTWTGHALIGLFGPADKIQGAYDVVTIASGANHIIEASAVRDEYEEAHTWANNGSGFTYDANGSSGHWQPGSSIVLDAIAYSGTTAGIGGCAINVGAANMLLDDNNVASTGSLPNSASVFCLLNQQYIYMRGRPTVAGSTGLVNVTDVNGVVHNFTEAQIHAGGLTPWTQTGSGTASGGGVLAVTFANAFSAAPNCTCVDTNAAPASCGVSTAATSSGVTFTLGSARADAVQWSCSGFSPVAQYCDPKAGCVTETNP